MTTGKIDLYLLIIISFFLLLINQYVIEIPAQVSSESYVLTEKKARIIKSWIAENKARVGGGSDSTLVSGLSR